MRNWLICLCIAALMFLGCVKSDEDIKSAARRSSVQVVFNIPVLKVSYTTPYEEDKKIDIAYLNEMLEKKDKEIEEKIKKAIEAETAAQNVDKFETFPTLLDAWYKPVSKTMIPLGAVLKRDDVKFLDRIIVACKTEKQDISETEKKYEKDILTISETANVSPSTAKDIISRLRTAGYSVNKEEVLKSSDIKLLWFQYNWGDSPTELKWFVKVEGTDNNIITGYFNGIIETQPIPDDKMVHVYAQYLDTKLEFKEKSNKVKELEVEINTLKEDQEKLKEEIKEKDKELNKGKETKKRDISTATLMDVMFGSVKLEQMWMLSHGTGVYLGEIRTRDAFYGYNYERLHSISEATSGLILTNAHVAVMTVSFEVYVSKDKEVMWIVLPGIPSIRYTGISDFFGSPASLLFYNDSPILSHDYDCALMITTPIATMKDNAAVLGNSDNVKEGNKIISVGNPSVLQKFTTQGVVANTSFSILDSIYSSVFLEEIKTKPAFNWLKNSRFWFDAPIGVGGTSGSGVWATSGSEAGKVIAIHNMGMVCGYFSIASASKPENIQLSDSGYYLTCISDYIKENKKKFINRTDLKNISYIVSGENFKKDNEELFENLSKKYCMSAPLAGLNGGIPINYIKMYLEEMGLKYKDYGWEGLTEQHWEK